MPRPKTRKRRPKPEDPSQPVEVTELADFVPESKRIGLDKSWREISISPCANIERATMHGHEFVRSGKCDDFVVCQEAPGVWHVFGRRAKHE